jgi:hypothetical protein
MTCMALGRYVVVGAMLLGSAARPAAASASGAPAGDAWVFKVMPYVWALGVRGKMGPAAQPVNINMDFGDVKSLADSGFTLTAEAAYRETWGLLGDLLYLKLSQDGTGPQGDPASLETDLGIYTLGVARRVSQGVEVYAGARWFAIDSEVDLGTAPGLSNRTDYVDPLVGIRLTGMVSERLRVKVATDFGGFGIGSDITWQVLTSAHYSFSEMLSGLVGYRALDVSYDKDDAIMALGMKGLIFGLGVSF